MFAKNIIFLPAEKLQFRLPSYISCTLTIPVIYVNVFFFVASLVLLQISEEERMEKVKELAFESIFETKVEHTDYFKV